MRQCIRRTNRAILFFLDIFDFVNDLFQFWGLAKYSCYIYWRFRASEAKSGDNLTSMPFSCGLFAALLVPSASRIGSPCASKTHSFR